MNNSVASSVPAALPHWETHGGSGPHLLLVHGLLSSRAQWSLNIAALQKFCQPVSLELFGHGRSPSPEDPDCYRPAHYLKCFEAIREELGIEQWFVLGYSLGAGLTIRYAVEYPQHVIGHIFTNSTSGLADEEQVAAWRDSATETAARIRSGGHAAMERIPVHPKHARKLPQTVVRKLVQDAALHSPDGVARTLEITNPEVSARSLIGRNSRPALLVFGARERRFQAHKAYVEANMPQLTIAELDAGHGMNMEAADAFNKAVESFLATCLTS